MKRQETLFPKATSIRQGLTPIPTDIYEISKTLGITHNDIVTTLQKKSWIRNCITLLIVAASIVYFSAIFVKANHYGGISIQDFNIIGQIMYNSFGSIF